MTAKEEKYKGNRRHFSGMVKMAFRFMVEHKGGHLTVLLHKLHFHGRTDLRDAVHALHRKQPARAGFKL